jgi:hypothetical protein
MTQSTKNVVLLPLPVCAEKRTGPGYRWHWSAPTSSSHTIDEGSHR